MVYNEALSASSVSAALVGANTNNALAAGSGNVTGALADIIAELGGFATPTTATASSTTLTVSADELTVTITLGGTVTDGVFPAGVFTPTATYTDRFGGNTINTAVTQTAAGSWDATAPQLVSVTLADAGNAGAATGDTITLVYNEALSAASISAALVGANTNNALAAGSGNITGALADIIAELGSFATPTTATASAATLALSADGRTVTLTLGGTVADGVFPGGLFTPAATYGDTHGNTVNTAVTQTATGTWDATAPQLVSVTLGDAANAGAGAGDTIGLVYNEALSAASISAALVGANTNNALAAGSGNITGALADIVAELGGFATPTTATASATALALSADGRTVTITLGGTVADGAFPGGLFTPAAAYSDTHGNTVNTAVTQTATGTWDATAPQLVSVTLADAGNAGAGVGDTITLVYNEALSASSISAALVGANINNALGAGSGNITGALADVIAELGGFAIPTAATASVTTLTLSADGRTATIALGGTVADGVFPGGVFTPAATYTDRFGGNTINTTVTPTATGSWDATAPQLVSVTLGDAGNAGAGVGDTITLVYNEALSASSISSALVGSNTNNALAAGSGNVTGALANVIAELGNFATPASATASATTLTLSADGRTVTITLGGTVVDGTFPAGVFTLVATYSDPHGNTVTTAVTQTATGTWDGTAPQLVSVTLADAGNAGAGVGDTIALVYDEALSASSISTALVGGNTNNALATGSGNITGALADIVAELGSFATPTTATASATTLTLSADGRTVTVTLGGTLADGVFPAGVFTPAASYTDAHGNVVNTAVTQTATGTWDGTAPQLVSVTLADAGNAGAGAGDTITLVYNEALSAASISAALIGASVNNALAAGSGNITGTLANVTGELGSFATPTTATASATTLTLSADGRTVTLTLGGTVADGVFPAGVFTPVATYTDTHGNIVSTAITQTATGTWDGTAPQLVSVTLADAGNAGAGAGDTITLLYNEALSASSISAALMGGNTNNALAAGSGNITGALADIIAELGSFATPTTATASATTLTLSADGRTVTLTLGGTVVDGVFPAGVVTPTASYADAHGERHQHGGDADCHRELGRDRAAACQRHPGRRRKRGSGRRRHHHAGLQRGVVCLLDQRGPRGGQRQQRAGCGQRQHHRRPGGHYRGARQLRHTHDGDRHRHDAEPERRRPDGDHHARRRPSSTARSPPACLPLSPPTPTRTATS